MMYLISLYRMVEDKELFISLFSDLDYELNEMGWSEDPNTLINDMLFNHFGLTMESDKQLEMLTQCIINKKDLSFLRGFNNEAV